MKKSGVFIGGTGRSGTTILAEILNQHPKIYSLPYESRFITDPDGLNTLYKSMYPYWSFFQSDIAITRFIQLMQNLGTRYKGKYPTFGISEYLYPGAYDSILEEYISNLKVQSFKSAWAGRTNLFQKVISRFMNKKGRLDFLFEDSYYVPPINEEAFLQCTRQFLESYFQNLKDAGNAHLIVDHTPSNISYAGFIKKVLADSKIIHIYRNPLDIICSFETKDWGSKDLDINTQWIFDTLRQWSIIKETLPTDSYLEIKFEHLIEKKESELNKITGFLSLDLVPEFSEVDVSKHNIGRWKKTMDTKTAERIFSDHAGVFEELGYSI